MAAEKPGCARLLFRGAPQVAEERWQMVNEEEDMSW